jgi:hypothetical protein
VAPPQTARPERPRVWRVEARTGWYRPGRESVALRLAEAIAGDARASDAKAVSLEDGFAVTFTVSCPSELPLSARVPDESTILTLASRLGPRW